MLDLPQGNQLHTLQFAKLVRNAHETERRLPIVAMDAYKVTEATDFLLNKSSGRYSHHFILVEIGDEPPIYARVDFQGHNSFRGDPIAHSITLSDDRASLTPGTTSFAGVSNSSPGGPTLDAFATLLEIMHRRTPRYDVLSRNCLWLTESILYATGRRYAEHWRAERVAPLGLQRYIDGVIKATRAVAEIYTDNHPAKSVLLDAGLKVVRGLQWFFTHPAGNSRIRYPDEEIQEILEEWENEKNF
ncbi:hypothetical protein C8F04DRAFT_1248165 [Mycena alexandri]|uniref:Uncharacterized protein n=1 Tax=Mycena alexandri TaxID=1745969 RepID=A0AAD6XCA4_9AGAR|nr:hypothetical protein C8F04DRAFT_1248165 [Mycena alexandri]